MQDSNALSFGPIQGQYSALLQGSSPAAESTASIGQTGTIPNMAESLTFWADVVGTLQVSFNGQMLSFVDVSNALNYSVYAADISPFAGQTGQLLFTAPIQDSDLLDNIQFSTSPIPEPGTLDLATLGGVILVSWRRRKLAEIFPFFVFKLRVNNLESSSHCEG